MDESQEILIRQVVQEVLHRLSSQDERASTSPVRRNKILVLGDPQGLCLEGSWTIETEADYEASGGRMEYDAVYITRITNAQLCDIALGRDSTAFTCAALRALMKGVPVRMRKDAPVWRKFSQTAPKLLVRTLCGYEETLAAFGVEMTDACLAVPGSSKDLGTDKAMVVTAEIAREMCEKGGDVCLPPKSIVTPLAKDVFLAARVKVEYVAGKRES